ncbi:MAG: SPOR domain-containing protein, partial [Pseudomonadota bacterium]
TGKAAPTALLSLKMAELDAAYGQKAAPPSPPKHADAPKHPSPKEALPPSTAPLYFAQLGAFSNRARAEDHIWRSRGDLHGTALRLISRYGSSVQPFSRNGDILYRALLGPMSEVEARNTCRQMKTACFISPSY